jgi:hypothetical protein
MTRELAMIDIYAMRRANGDWFALDDYGRLRVPVFRSRREAIEAQWCNPEMMLFRPVVLDEHMLDQLEPSEIEGNAGYWLVNNPSINLKRGQPLEHASLVLLIRNATQRPQG